MNNSGIANEITKRLQVESQSRGQAVDIVHMARLITVGQMASGFAHEVNQPLTAITNFADTCEQMLLADEPPSKEKLRDLVSNISAQAYRSGEIIRQLRTLVRKAEPYRFMVDIHELIREVVALLDADAHLGGIWVTLELRSSISEVFADPIQIQQVLLNLMRNAFDAVRDEKETNRKVTIGTSVANREVVEIAVNDTGKGLEVDDPERLFEPFFTTKSEGIGIGLTISRWIISAHGQRLWAASNRNGGATFRFSLPVSHHGSCCYEL